MLSLSVNRWGFTDKLFENTTCPEEGGFSRIKSHSVRQRLSGISEVLTKKMRCVTRNDATQNWIESNNLHVGFWCKSLNVNEIE